MKASEITLERVREAYRKHGLEPACGHAEVQDGRTCAMGALLVAAGRAWGEQDVRSIGQAERVLDLSTDHVTRDYLSEFVAGFDQGFVNFERSSTSAAYARGHEVGLALRTEGVK